MRIKSYFSGTVEAALEAARKELGPEAMLLNSRRAAERARHLGEYEVVFASGPEADESDEPHPKTLGELSGHVAGLRRQVERLAASLVEAHRAAPAATPPDAAQELDAVKSFLLARDIAPDLAGRVVAALAPRLAREGRNRVSIPAWETKTAARSDSRREARPGLITAVFRDQSLLQQMLVAELEALIAVDASLGRPGANRKVVALVGPPGSGKTTALVKLAVKFMSLSRGPAFILSADTQRIAAAEQLRSYAAIAGLGFEQVETPHALSQALEALRHKELILIDTPGFAPREMQQASDLARLLSTHPEIDCHLVLTASAKLADLSGAADRYDVFRPAKLLFTRLDETESTGSLLSEAALRGKAISFLSQGQSIPEDIEEASKERIMDLLIGDVWIAGAPFASMLHECERRMNERTGSAAA